MIIDRRMFLGASVMALAGSPGFTQGAAQPDMTALYEAAKRDRELTWYIGHWEGEFANKVGEAFGATYPGVSCNVIRLSSQVIYQRLAQDFRVQAANCDVFSSADNGQFVTLERDQRLLAYVPLNLAFCPPVLRDPSHLTCVTDSNPTVLCYNTGLVSEAEIPGKWTDFLDPKWSGQIAVAHPGYSGAMGAWVVAMNNLYGWDYFEKLKRNNPQVGRSLIDPPGFVASGERRIGMSSLATIGGLADKGNLIKPAFAEDGIILNVGMSGIIATTTKPNAAKLFVEFMLSKTVGEMTREYHATPVRSDIAPGPGIPSLGAVKGIRNDPVEIETKLPGLIDKWRDLFGV